MTEMYEKVLNAISVAMGSCDVGIEEIERATRGVFEALYEPTQEMAWAGSNTGAFPVDIIGDHRRDAVHVFTTMISAALGETK